MHRALTEGHRPMSGGSLADSSKTFGIARRQSRPQATSVRVPNGA